MIWSEPQWGVKQFIVVAMFVILLLTRIFRKNEFVSRYKDLSSVIVFITVEIVLGIEFYQKKIYIGMAVLVLAAIAIAKFYYDKYRRDQE